MKVLVTGGCGFIGHHLVTALINRGDTVFIVDDLSGVGARDRCDSMQYEVVYHKLHRSAKYSGMFKAYFVVEETNGVLLSVEDFCGTYNGGNREIDVIYSLAAVSRTVPAIEDPWQCMSTNVIGSVGVLELARQFKVPRVVMSSSNVVYASDTPYKASKLMMEEACKAYHETYGVSVICLRYSNVYGPGFAKGDPACLAAMRDSLVDRGYLEITGDGEQTRDFTHVDDIVAGNLAAAESGYCGTVDLCTGRNVSMNNAATMLMGSLTGIKHDPLLSTLDQLSIRHIDDRRGDCKHIIQDPNPAKDILGWSAQVKFEDGVKDVWRY